MTDERLAEFARLDAAIMANSNDADALEARAQLRASGRHFEDSFADCLAAWRLRADVRARDWAARGEDYLARGPKFLGPETDRWTIVQAATCFSLALRDEPDNSGFYARRAHAWIDLDNSKRASCDLKKARELDGESAERWRLWARLYERMCGAQFATHVVIGYSRRQEERARAHAFYTVAIEQAPGLPGLYLARARVTAPDFPQLPLFDDPQCADYLSALRLKPNFRAPRKKIVGMLAMNFKAQEASAHEQLEAWLNARAELRERGLRPKLVGQILREVARVMAS